MRTSMEKQIIKRNQINSTTKNYNNWNENIATGVQQNWEDRMKDEESWKYKNLNYPIKRTERKEKLKWLETNGLWISWSKPIYTACQYHKEERGEMGRDIEEIMSKNFSNLAQNMKKQNQETVSLSRINSHISTLRHIIIKLFKEKESWK